MAVASNTITIATQVGNREDLADKLYMVAPAQTPFLTAAGGLTKARAFYTEWLTQSLNAASATNKAVDGDAAITNSAQTPSARVGNYIQALTKQASVALGQEAVETAGDNLKLKQETAKKIIEIKRDLEMSCLSENASVAMTGSVAGQMGGIRSWITTNTSRGASGANGGFSGGIVAAPTPGTLRAFTVTQLNTVLQTRFDNGGIANDRLLAFMDSTTKGTFSTFTGLSINRYELKSASYGGSNGVQIAGAVEVYLSDFGEIVAVPHAYGLGTRHAAVIIDPSMVEVAALRPIEVTPQPQTGLAKTNMVSIYATLKCLNEKAHATVNDLN